MNSARQLVILLLATDYCAQKFVLESIRRAIKPFHMTKNVTGIICISVSADFFGAFNCSVDSSTEFFCYVT